MNKSIAACSIAADAVDETAAATRRICRRTSQNVAAIGALLYDPPFYPLAISLDFEQACFEIFPTFIDCAVAVQGMGRSNSWMNSN